MKIGKNRILRSCSCIFTYGWCVFSLAGLFWIVLASFKSQRTVFSGGYSLPEKFLFQNYKDAWNNAYIEDYFFNSLSAVSISVVLLVLFAAPAAYVLSRAKFKIKGTIINYIIMGISIPVPLLFIPLFFMLSRLHLTNNLWGLIIVFVASSLPFTIYFLIGFFSNLPKALEESAFIDGANEWQIFFLILFPLSIPGVATVSIFNFIWLWNELQLTLVIIHSNAKKTLPVGLYGLQNSMQYTSNWPGFFAGVIIVLIPTIIVFIVFSRKIVAGVTSGAVK